MITARIGPSLFALACIFSINAATAAESKPGPDPQLCAEYLRDLKAYRRMAVLLGCQMPEGSDQVATLGADETQFPPIVADEPASTEAPAVAEQAFPPVVDEPASTETQTSFPPVEEASTEPAAADLPPVVSESSGSSGRVSSGRKSRGSSSEASDLPPVVASSTEDPDETVEDPADPVRAAIEEKLITLKEEAKARITDAILTKAEEVKERVKEKIKHKIDDAIAHHNQHNDGAPTLRRAAKDAVKRVLSERHHRGGGLLSKLAQLRRR